MGIVAFFFPWHTAEYANHFSLKQAWGFHYPRGCLLPVSHNDPQRLMSPPSADGWGKHRLTRLDFTDASNMISPTVGKQFESLTYFHTGACTLSILSSSKAQQNSETFHATSLQDFIKKIPILNYISPQLQ